MPRQNFFYIYFSLIRKNVIQLQYTQVVYVLDSDYIDQERKRISTKTRKEKETILAPSTRTIKDNESNHRRQKYCIRKLNSLS